MKKEKRRHRDKQYLNAKGDVIIDTRKNINLIPLQLET